MPDLEHMFEILLCFYLQFFFFESVLPFLFLALELKKLVLELFEVACKRSEFVESALFLNFELLDVLPELIVLLLSVLHDLLDELNAPVLLLDLRTK